MSRKLKLTLSSALVAALLVAGCGTDKQESVTVKLETFTSPKANIGCIADETMVRCDIKRHSWKVKKDPKCPLDYGNGLSVTGQSPGKVVCAGDTTLNSGPALPPDQINLVGSFECQSNTAGDGMHCENTTTGHGFDLDPENYSTF